MILKETTLSVFKNIVLQSFPISYIVNNTHVIIIMLSGGYEYFTVLLSADFQMSILHFWQNHLEIFSSTNLRLDPQGGLEG